MKHKRLGICKCMVVMRKLVETKFKDGICELDAYPLREAKFG